MMATKSEDEIYKGYYASNRETLKKFGVKVWSEVEIETTRGRFEGTILPRAESMDDLHVVIKLASGYNVGIATSTITDMKEVAYREAHYKIPEKEFPFTEGMPFVKLLGTGGTIASRLDYRTGAVVPAFTPGELYGSCPELGDICNLDTEKLYGVFSENMGPDEYKCLAEAIGEEIEKGVDGIVIGHGTDTMHHTAGILSFMVQNSPIPIVLVGSQRSSDRPSSDAALNLIHSVSTAAHSDIAEVMVCMFGPTSDMYGLLHRGTRVRKMHSSYRSTFRTIGDIPIAMVDKTSIKPLTDDYNKRRDDKNVTIQPYFDERVGMVYYYPNMQPDMIDNMLDSGYKGIVIAGTGLGHVNKPLYPALERAQKMNVPVFMTVQTLWGYVHMDVYETGRDMQAIGVVPCANLLPEVAYVKLGWAMGKAREEGKEGDVEYIREIMLTPISSDITEREPINGYHIFQGGIPEVEEFTSSIYK